RSAALRATISVTGLKGSDKVNVIPGETTALIDCRLLPGDDAKVFLETLKRVAAEPDLKWEIIASSVATESTTDTDLFRAIERARDRFDPGVPVLTPPLLSTTDATTFRQAGMVIYGFEAWRIKPDDDQSHGDDERLSLANIRFGVEAMFFIVWEVCGRN
ncbi:MAG: peptidase dimerization domain-containing protein, partial [Blastocatellia bacterium]